MSTKRKPAKAAATKKTGPVARVWEVASSMPRAKRAAIIEACVGKGINVNTAKTQYHRWLHRNDKAGR